MISKPMGPEQSQSTPERAPAQTIPPLAVDWQGERDAGHLWNAISTLREKTGELSASVSACNVQLSEFRTDLKEIDTGINEIKTEQRSTAKSIRIIGFVAAPVVSIAAIVAPYFWTYAMRPQLEKSIATAVKAEIEKENAAREKALAYEKEIADLKAQLRRANRPSQ